ncbi:MAG: hypothetical protein KDD60_08810 [Bdellovibrionales bacterium]|nr:hypothetical protein [Bdellovibrionales bacterium]
MGLEGFLPIAVELEDVGLLWHPEIGDEISSRENLTNVSVLVDTGGLTPRELRENYLWLPTVEQMLLQVEVRQAILFHAGLEMSEHSYCYKTVLKSKTGAVEGQAYSLRDSLGRALCDLLVVEKSKNFH